LREGVKLANLKSITDASFQADVLDSAQPVLVDFWAEWCGPCKMLTPVLEAVAVEYKEKLSIVKLNVDENPETAPKFGVRGIPTLILFQQGEVVATKVGALTQSQLMSFLDESL
jgi:thioredoxin 1